MKSLLAIGECMMELREADKDTLYRSYAGDTYNSAVYAKRWAADLNVSFFSALGRDPLSDQMIDVWQSHGLNCSCVLKSDDRLPGIYAINIDEHGERSFVYWRDQSAATRMMQLLEKAGGVSVLGQHDIAYVSGISFAILSELDKEALLSLLIALKSRGAKIAYDPNVRLRMWDNRELARRWNDRVYQICDIALPGLEDHSTLYGHTNHTHVKSYLSQFAISKIIIKCDDDGVYVYEDTEPAQHHPFQAAARQVDSTAAGDSFAGTYLAAQLSGSSTKQSVIAAMKVARIVVQHKGAIAPREAMSELQA